VEGIENMVIIRTRGKIMKEHTVIDELNDLYELLDELGFIEKKRKEKEKKTDDTEKPIREIPRHLYC
jgi:hypothetical protein